MDAICGAGIGGSGILRLDAVFGNDACHGQHPCRFTVCLRSAKETKVERSEFFDNWHRPKSLLRKVFPAKSLISRGRGGEKREGRGPPLRSKTKGPRAESARHTGKFQAIGLAKLGVSQGKTRIGFHRGLERIQRKVEIFRSVVALHVS